MSTSLSLPVLYALYRLLNPPLPTPLAYLPIIFRLLALAIAAPFLFITLLEVAGYLVVRTLGFTTRLPASLSLPPSTVGSQTATPTSEQPTLPGVETPVAVGVQPVPVPPAEKSTSDAHRLAPPSQILIPSNNASLSDTEKYAYFATPGEHDFKLGGTGLFSPPDSREGSPPPLSAMSTGSEGETEVSGVGKGGEGKSSALGLGVEEQSVRSRAAGGGGVRMKPLTPVEAR